jgi:hypothetical protein
MGHLSSDITHISGNQALGQGPSEKSGSLLQLELLGPIGCRQLFSPRNYNKADKHYGQIVFSAGYLA